MSDYKFPQAPEIESAYRAAYLALNALVSPGHAADVTDEGAPVTELITDFRSVVDAAENVVAARLGPRITWRGPHEEGDWDLTACGIDLDTAQHDFGVALGDDAVEGLGGGWHGSALARAALAYKREARWDIAPGDAGIWLLMLAPVSASGGGDGDWFYSGNLTGFVILHDRDGDDVYESVAHIWTAIAWRRRGIARRLMAEARSRFSVTGVEEPYTRDGEAFLRATN